MKKITFIALALFVLTTAKSQTEQGNFLLGLASNLALSDNGPNAMSIGYSNAKLKSDYGVGGKTDYWNIYLTPKVGWFIIDNLALGTELAAGYGNHDGASSSVIGIGPFLRYYLSTSNVKPLLEGSGVFGVQGFDKSSSIFYGFGAGAGLAFMVGENAMIDMLLNYNGSILRTTAGNPDNERVVLTNVGMKIGFVFAF